MKKKLKELKETKVNSFNFNGVKVTFVTEYNFIRNDNVLTCIAKTNYEDIMFTQCLTISKSIDKTKEKLIGLLHSSQKNYVYLNLERFKWTSKGNYDLIWKNN